MKDSIEYSMLLDIYQPFQSEEEVYLIELFSLGSHHFLIELKILQQQKKNIGRSFIRFTDLLIIEQLVIVYSIVSDDSMQVQAFERKIRIYYP